jgi:hypothetical protein
MQRSLFIMILAKRLRTATSSRFAVLRRVRLSERMCCHNARLKKLGIHWGGTMANGAVAIEAVFCLGLWASGDD